MVYCVLFTIELKHDKDVPVFLKGFRTLQEFVWKQEPGTVTYEMHQCVLNEEEQKNTGVPTPLHPRRFMVLERYRSKEDFAEVHLKSETFGNFFKLVQSIEAVETSLKEFSSEEMVPQLKAFSPGPNAAVEAPQKLVAKGALILAGSRTGARPAYVKEAEALGELVVKTLQRPFLYGGGTIGLMGAAANAAKRVPGSHVVAVIPEALKPREVSGDMICDKLYVSEDMSERKSIMLRHADMIIALPGGFGTFDELFEYLTLFQLNAARQKIGLLNVEGFFNTFIAHVEFLIAEGFLNKEAMGYFVIEPTAAELVEALQRFTPPPASLPLQW